MMLTILLPNYKTELLTKLCLRSLRKYTDFSQVKILAIDNASGDGSAEYLRSIPWIQLVERTPEEIAGLPPPVMHTTALDLGLSMVDTEYVMSFHTDTIVINPHWLDYMMNAIKDSPKTAGVGSWKLEVVPPLKAFVKKVEDTVKETFHLRKKEFRFLRSHCALYRTELLRKYTKGFGDNACAGSSIQRHLLDAGYEMKFLPPEELSKYMLHLNHATMILNAAEFAGRKTHSPKAAALLAEKLGRKEFEEILNDSSLDR